MTLGQRGEMAAWKYLADRGYKIIEKNYRAPMGEMDVIAEKAGRFIFVEIKTRRGQNFGLPQEAVGLTKQKKLAQIASFYLKKQKKENARVSFEVLAVLWNEEGVHKYTLIENAFELQGEF